MKNLIKGITFLLLAATVPAQAQDPNGKFACVDIHTNAVCNDCKQRIESELIYAKGVQSVKVDLDKENIHVEYKATKTDPAAIRKAVAMVGYLADDVQPDAKARAALPDCCRMSADEHNAPPPAPPVPSTAPETVPVPPAPQH